MSQVFLGIDTSNYSTSAALYDATSDTAMLRGQLIPILQGSIGVRQSEVFFHHTKQLPNILEELPMKDICGIGVSTRPRLQEGSYMPCFLAGEAFAKALSHALQVPLFRFSHQQGHIAAAAWSAKQIQLLDQDFLAWHVSGGTTELLQVNSSRALPCKATIIGGTADLCAGQLIDRVGNQLGLSFPAGPQLEELAKQHQKEIPLNMRSNELQFNLSGLENKALQLRAAGEQSADVADFILRAVLHCITNATQCALEQFPTLPVLCAGGVMSNMRLREALEKTCGATFAQPEFSKDNAFGVAFLAHRVMGEVNA